MIEPPRVGDGEIDREVCRNAASNVSCAAGRLSGESRSSAFVLRRLRSDIQHHAVPLPEIGQQVDVHIGGNPSSARVSRRFQRLPGGPRRRL